MSFDSTTTSQRSDEDDEGASAYQNVRGSAAEFGAHFHVFMQLNFHPYPDAQNCDTGYLKGKKISMTCCVATVQIVTTSMASINKQVHATHPKYEIKHHKETFHAGEGSDGLQMLPHSGTINSACRTKLAHEYSLIID